MSLTLSYYTFFSLEVCQVSWSFLLSSLTLFTILFLISVHHFYREYCLFFSFILCSMLLNFHIVLINSFSSLSFYTKGNSSSSKAIQCQLLKFFASKSPGQLDNDSYLTKIFSNNLQMTRRTNKTTQNSSLWHK